MNIAAIHQVYQELQSLEKTCTWLADEHDFHINRQSLSRLFRENGLYVNPPNGWPDLYWEQTTAHLDGVGRFATEMIKLAFDDITNPTGIRMDYLSAAYFLSSEFYDTLLAVVASKVPYTNVWQLTPTNVDVSAIVTAREIYERNRRFWLP